MIKQCCRAGWSLGFVCGVSGASLAQSAPPSTSSATHNRLVAEATIVQTGPAQHKIYLPVKLHGRLGTLVVYFVQLPATIQVATEAIGRAGIAPTATQLDSLTVGTIVMRDLTFQSFPRQQFGETAPPKFPPIIGVAGNAFLDAYDVVIDGPAHRVRLYTRDAGAGLPPGITAAVCTPTQPMPEGHTGFVLQANGHPTTVSLQTYFGGLTIMNDAGAQVLGLTPQAPTVRAVPDNAQILDYQGVPNRYVATGVHLTLGTRAFRDTPVHLLANIPLEPTPTTPAMELTLQNLLDQVFVLSQSTGQACLAQPTTTMRNKRA